LRIKGAHSLILSHGVLSLELEFYQNQSKLNKALRLNKIKLILTQLLLPTTISPTWLKLNLISWTL